MMDFTLSEEQQALQEMAREFAQKELRPVAAKYDQSHEFAYDVMGKAFQAGFHGKHPRSLRRRRPRISTWPSFPRSWPPAAPAFSPA